MGFASIQDTIAIESEATWAERDVPRTLYQMLTRTKDKNGAG